MIGRWRGRWSHYHSQAESWASWHNPIAGAEIPALRLEEGWLICGSNVGVFVVIFMGGWSPSVITLGTYRHLFLDGLYRHYFWMALPQHYPRGKCGAKRWQCLYSERCLVQLNVFYSVYPHDFSHTLIVLYPTALCCWLSTFADPKSNIYYKPCLSSELIRVRMILSTIINCIKCEIVEFMQFS